jgi:N-acetylglucosamine-6-phosphate deacetylase
VSWYCLYIAGFGFFVKIRAGKAIDFAVLNPDMTLLATYLDGKLRYQVKD